MSAADVTRFFEMLESDPALQERARAAGSGPAAAEALIAMAAEAGLVVTADDLAEANAVAGGAELTDAALQAVAGAGTGNSTGTTCDAVGFFSGAVIVT